MHELVWSNLIVKKLKGVEQQTVLKMIDKIENIKANPQFYLKEMKGLRTFRLRFGDYHFFLDLDEQKKKIYLLGFGHKGQIYSE